MKGKRLLVNTVVMTLSSLFMRSLGLMFQVYLSRRMGASGIGLFQLVMSVSSLATTFAISGIRFATTRLVSEEVGSGRPGGAAAVMRRCLAYSAAFGSMASVLLYSLAGYIGVNVIGDARTVLSLRLLSVSLPFLSTGAVLGGYFTGICRVGKAVAANISEQICRIVVSVLLLGTIRTVNLELMCACVVMGGVAGEIFSFFVILALYLRDPGRRGTPVTAESGITGRIVRIAMPLAATAYARVALNTVQNLLIPMGLRRSGASAEAALPGYGMIQGMVFPIITFPMVLFASVSELIVPELTEEQVRGNDRMISASANMLLRLCFLFSAGVTGVLLCFSDELGEVFYKSTEAGHYIRLLALLMPIMYMDNITDGMLRGLGQHIYSMGVNILDSLISTALIWFLLPRYAVYGYIFILYASEIFNFSLSMGRLSRITSINAGVRGMALSAVSAMAGTVLTRCVVDITGGAHGIVGLILGVGIFILVYITFSQLFHAVRREELFSIARAMR